MERDHSLACKEGHQLPSAWNWKIKWLFAFQQVSCSWFWALKPREVRLRYRSHSRQSHTQILEWYFRIDLSCLDEYTGMLSTYESESLMEISESRRSAKAKMQASDNAVQKLSPRLWSQIGGIYTLLTATVWWLIPASETLSFQSLLPVP